MTAREDSASDERPPQRNPFPTVDTIIELSGDRIVLIERRNEPLGWALPGGFIDGWECAEDAAIREAAEECTLTIQLKALLGVYSAPSRDSRAHTLSMVYVASAEGKPVAADDAASARAVHVDDLYEYDLAFDHALIIADYLEYRRTGATAPLRVGQE